MSPSYTHTLLSTRLFVRDMALLAEGLVMVDMHTAETAAATIAAGTGAGVQPGGFWSFDADAPEGTAAEIAQRRAMESRERHPFWAPDKVGEVRMRPRSRADACEVRRRRAAWARLLKRRYAPHALAWTDTAVGTEKAAAVTLFFPPSDLFPLPFPPTDLFLAAWRDDPALRATESDNTPAVSSPGGQGGVANGLPAAERRSPLIVIAFRGSKKASDYFVTDLSPRFAPLHTRAAPKPKLAQANGPEPEPISGQQLDLAFGPDSDTRPDPALDPDSDTRPDPDLGPDSDPMSWLWTDESEARLLPVLANSERPCVTVGVWRAYAGAPARAHPSSTAETPRRAVRRAVAKALRRHPMARVVVTGHSLGGALAQLCAYDLLTSCPEVTERGAGAVTLVSFAAPRMFNRAFRRRMDMLEASERLAALRVVVSPDIIPRLPPGILGGHHGVSSRLDICPSPRGGTRLALSTGDHSDARLWRQAPADAHCCHAIFLAAEATPRRRHCLPEDAQWPLAGPGGRRAVGGPLGGGVAATAYGDRMVRRRLRLRLWRGRGGRCAEAVDDAEGQELK